MSWQFRVVDGADQGRIHFLPDTGIATIGSSRVHADVTLNDLYVQRIHAEVEIDGQRVVITAHDSPAGTLVNNQKIQQQEIHHGDMVRMGNSHLRLEDIEIVKKESPPPEDDVPELEVEVLEEPGGAEAGSPAVAVVEPDEPEVVVEPVVEEDAAAKAQPLPENRLKELVGHNLAHFQVEAQIAKGHGSMLFQARDLKKDQLVALKVLAPDFPHTEAEMKRYVEVWKAVLPLRHPNLVSLLGVGKSGPFCWLSMELVESAPLPEMIERLSKRETIDWQRPYRVAVQIGRALDYVHKRQLVHANITARNILWNSGAKTAKLADLGLAIALQGSNLRKIAMREKLQADLAYFSPEQTEPDNFVDGVCDIYSLGVVVYALATGRFPYTGATLAEMIRNIREAKLTKPTKLQLDMPPRFEAILLKMLAKRQENRYQTAEEMLADLQVVGEEEDALV